MNRRRHLRQAKEEVARNAVPTNPRTIASFPLETWVIAGERLRLRLRRSLLISADPLLETVVLLEGVEIVQARGRSTFPILWRIRRRRP